MLPSSVANCTYLLLSSARLSLKPVTFRPGCPRFCTSPMPSELPTLMKRMGVLGACRFTAIDAVVPVGISSLTPRWESRTTACDTSSSLLVHTTSS